MPLTIVLVNNAGPVPIRNAFNLSMIIANQKTTGTAGTILLVNDIVLGLALGLLFMVTALVMAPAIRAVLKQKAFVFQVRGGASYRVCVLIKISYRSGVI